MNISPKYNLRLLLLICIQVQKNLCTRKVISKSEFPQKFRGRDGSNGLGVQLHCRRQARRWQALSFSVGISWKQESHYRDVPMATNTTSISAVSAYHYTVVKDSLGREDCIVTRGSEPLGPLYTFFTIKITSGGHLRFSSTSSHKSRLQVILML